jgi:hypothetical protein
MIDDDDAIGIIISNSLHLCRVVTGQFVTFACMYVCMYVCAAGVKEKKERGGGGHGMEWNGPLLHFVYVFPFVCPTNRRRVVLTYHHLEGEKINELMIKQEKSIR